jgi:hypothetical protein
MEEVPELTSASYLTMKDVRQIQRGELSVDVFGTVHGDGIQRLDKTHFNVIGDGEVSPDKVGFFYGDNPGDRAQLTSAGETFVKCGLHTARLIAELRRHAPRTLTASPAITFPDELGDFPDDPAWTLGLELRRDLPASFKKYTDLADLDAKACKGNVVEQTATHSSGQKYTLLYTDGCDGGNAAGLVLDKGTPVRLIRDFGLEALPAAVTPALKKALVRANKEIQSTGAVLQKSDAVQSAVANANTEQPSTSTGTQRSIPKEDMNRLQRTAQEIQHAVKTEQRIETLKQDMGQLPPAAQKKRAESLEAETMKLKLHKTWLQRHLPRVDAKLTAHGDYLGAAAVLALGSALGVASGYGEFSVLGAALSLDLLDRTRDQYFNPEAPKELEEFYKVHNPSQVSSARDLLRNYRVEHIVASLRKEYGAIPNGSTWTKWDEHNREYTDIYTQDPVIRAREAKLPVLRWPPFSKIVLRMNAASKDITATAKHSKDVNRIIQQLVQKGGKKNPTWDFEWRQWLKNEFDMQPVLPYLYVRKSHGSSTGNDDVPLADLILSNFGGGGMWEAYESAYARLRATGASRRASCLAALA